MKFQRKRLALPAVAVAAAFLAAGCCTVPGPQRALLLHPLPPAEAGYALSKGGLIYAGGSRRVSVRPVDWREMAECRVVTRQGSIGKMDASRHVFFAVQIENLSAQSLRFNPAGAEAVTEKGAPLPAAGFGEASFIPAAAGGGDLPIDLLASPAAAFIPAGETMAGLLAFQVPDRAAATVTLILEDLQTVPAEKALRFTFEAFPGSADERH